MTNDSAWPAELEALTAAPAHHLVLLENETVRVLDTRIAPGESTAVHHHRWPGVIYLLSWSDFVRRDAEGNVLFDSRTVQPMAPGAAIWAAPLPPHSVENVGSAELRVLTVEVKAAGASGGGLG